MPENYGVELAYRMMKEIQQKTSTFSFPLDPRWKFSVLKEVAKVAEARTVVAKPGDSPQPAIPAVADATTTRRKDRPRFLSQWTGT